MSEKINKNSSLTIRIECKTKEYLKKIAKGKGLTMSELVNECLADMVERENLKNNYNEQLEKRIIATDEKLFKLKEKLKYKKMD